jgi:hypothetical protein
MDQAAKDQTRQQWQVSFQNALMHDSWGQVVEAQEEYQAMAASIAAKQGNVGINSKEKDTMQRLVLCLSARAQALRTLNETISSTDMQALPPVFEALFTGREPEIFPIDAHKFNMAQPIKPSTEGEIIEAGDELAHHCASSDWHQSQAALKSVSGTVVAIRIEKIGLKDAQEYIDPFMTVLVADPRTNLLDTHDTGVAKERRATYVTFNHQVYLNISLEEMQRQAAALFFEFKHYKPKKKKVSTRCWAFMELSELKMDEEIVLELYHKPTDLRKKKFKLHTEKTLYLHLYATFIRS